MKLNPWFIGFIFLSAVIDVGAVWGFLLLIN